MPGSSRPNVARMYDYCLGGKDHLAADRAAVAALTTVLPDFCRTAVANRSFLVRAVRHMAGQGVRQFIDLGAGIPAAPNVHEVVRAVQPDARVVYVDNDPVVLAHLRARCATVPGVIAAQHDLTEPATVLGDTGIRHLINFAEPVGLLFGAVLHFVSSDLAPAVVASYRDAVPAGSQIAVSMLCGEGMRPAKVQHIVSVYSTANVRVVVRSVDQVGQLLGGFDLVEPGLVEVDRWHHDGSRGLVRILAGVGAKL
ncbi:MAG: SAM-dependent methyltransferase [Actinobacteria bacterium]|nr:SAM-dependent methyltransferase [Actinomycetota bacterium]